MTTRYQVTFIGKLSDTQKQFICLTIGRIVHFNTELLLTPEQFKTLYNALVLKNYVEKNYPN
jgi:hypothetical protein